MFKVNFNCGDANWYRVPVMFCETISTVAFGGRPKYKLENVKMQKYVRVDRELNKTLTKICKITCFRTDAIYCFNSESLIVDIDSVKSFVHYTDEQMKLNHLELETEWTHKTREDAIADANKEIDNMILKDEKKYFKTEKIDIINKAIEKFNKKPTVGLFKNNP